MADFVLEIVDDEFQKVTFYTVKWIKEDKHEFDKFLDKFENSEYRELLDNLLALLFEEIGNNKGALDCYFNRFENAATAMPPKGKFILEQFSLVGCPLRLYCLRISESIVVLFNGGLKTAETAQQSTHLRAYFHEAQIFANAIHKAIFIDKDLCLTKRYIHWCSGASDEIILS